MVSASKLFKAFTAFDLEAVVSEVSWVKDRRIRMMFLSLLALNIFTYFIFIAHQPLHNHGMNLWMAWNDQVWAGRWFNHVMLRVTYAANIPVILPVFASVMSSVIGIVLIKVWNLKLTQFEKFLVAGLVCAYPAFLAYYYYTWLTPLFMIGSLFAVLSLYFCNRLSVFNVLMGGAFFTLMMASYQPSLSVFATVAAASIIADLTQKNVMPLSDIARVTAARLLAAVIGGIGYIASLKILNIGVSHATKTLTIEQFPSRVVEVVQASFGQLIVTQPELFLPIKLMLLVFLGAAILASIYLSRKSVVRIALLLLLWPGVIIAIKAMFFVSSDNSLFQYRYNVSTAFLHAFTIALTLHAVSFKPARSINTCLGNICSLAFHSGRPYPARTPAARANARSGDRKPYIDAHRKHSRN